MIISYDQINKLVAESLGWSEVEFSGWEQGKVENLSVIKYLCCQSLNSVDQQLEYYRIYGYCPDFALNWEHTAFILEECDRQDLLVEIVMTKVAISCNIKSTNPADWTAKDFKPVTVGLEMPRIMSLAVALAWLNFRGFKFQEKLEIC